MMLLHTQANYLFEIMESANRPTGRSAGRLVGRSALRGQSIGRSVVGRSVGRSDTTNMMMFWTDVCVLVYNLLGLLSAGAHGLTRLVPHIIWFPDGWSCAHDGTSHTRTTSEP